MCGIAGIITKNELHPNCLNQFWNSTLHRGPDDRGFLVCSENEIVKSRESITSNLRGTMLFHQRLSIIDLDTSGWQPMSSFDNHYHITFNGEIYNYLEIREELQLLGYKFHSYSDTEVLLNAYIAWGEDALHKVVGMFSFAILDIQKQILFIARDHFGIKPLYYTFFNGGFAFSSEIKSLLCLPMVERKINPKVLYSYFRSLRTDFSEQTFYANIQQLKPANYMIVPIDNPNKYKTKNYWNLKTTTRNDLSFHEAANMLRELFLNSIQLHMRSDVPVSFALSGGIDSSAIVSTVRCLYPSKDIYTFSYIAGDYQINEEKWIDVVNDRVKSKQKKIILDNNIFVDLQDLISVHDQPFITTSIYAQYCIFRAVHQYGFKVTLDGQGADELLAGYRPYLLARMASLIKQGKKDEANLFFDNVSKLPGLNKGFWTRLTDYLLPIEIQKNLRESQGLQLFPDWLNMNWFESHNVNSLDFLVDYFDYKEVLKHVLYEALTKNNLPQLLRYEDTNSMLFSVESRVPFLTPDIAEFIFSLPEEYLITNQGETKAIFKEAMKGIVPSKILSRKDKIGFQTPEKEWLMVQRDWINDLFNSEFVKQIPFIDYKKMLENWSYIQEGKIPYDSRVWRWINVIRWIEHNQVNF